MKFSAYLSFLTLGVTTVIAQAATAADVALVRQQLVNVVASVGSLDTAVQTYTGPTDNDALLDASLQVIAELNQGTANINQINGTIDLITASTQLLDQVNALDSIVATTVADVQAQAPLLVSSCLGPTILAQLNAQLAAATAFRAAIEGKFAPGDQAAVNLVSQAALDSLNVAIQAFIGDTTLPAACQTTTTSSSAVPGPTQATDADVASVRQQLVNIVAAVTAFDQAVNAYSTAGDDDTVENAAQAVVDALNAGVNNVATVQGVISLPQAALQLNDQLSALNTITATASLDVQLKKGLFVNLCLGVTIYDLLNQQAIASAQLQATLVALFNPLDQAVITALSQPTLVSLNGLVQLFSDQTSLPVGCVAASSSISSTSSTTASSTALSTSSNDPGSSTASSTNPSSTLTSTTTSTTTSTVTSTDTLTTTSTETSTVTSTGVSTTATSTGTSTLTSIETSTETSTITSTGTSTFTSTGTGTGTGTSTGLATASSSIPNIGSSGSSQSSATGQGCSLALSTSGPSTYCPPSLTTLTTTYQADSATVITAAVNFTTSSASQDGAPPVATGSSGSGASSGTDGSSNVGSNGGGNVAASGSGSASASATTTGGAAVYTGAASKDKSAYGAIVAVGLAVVLVL